MQDSIAAQVFCEDFVGGFVAEAFSGTFVESVFHTGHRLMTDLCEIGAFGEEVSNETVGVFIGSALPGFVKQREVGLPVESLAQSLRFSKLLAVVECDAAPQRRRQGLQASHNGQACRAGLEIVRAAGV